MAFDERARATSAPAWLVRSAAIGGRLLVLAVLVWLIAVLAVKVTMLVVAVLVGLLLAGVASPLVERADRRGVPRWVSAGGAVLVLLAVLGGAALGLAARIADQLPELRDSFRSMSSDLSSGLGIELPWGSSSGTDGSGGSSEGTSAGDLLGPAQTAAEVAIAGFLTIALAFLFLTSGPGMWQWFLGKFGRRVRDDVDAAGRAGWATAGAYVRGLTVVALFDALAIGAGLLLLGVPLALTLAALQFLASYIPTIGAFVAGAAAVVVAYGSDGLATAAVVGVLVLVVQQVGNDVVEPWVMKNRLPLNAATVLIAVTAGGLLWGLAGALLFVPLTAAATAMAREIWVRHGSPPLAGA